MSWTAKYRKQRMCALTAAIVATAWMPVAMAADLPEVNKIEGKDNTQGVNITSDGTNMNVKITGIDGKAKGIANWDTFSISKDHSVNFTSDMSNWVVLNRVVGNDASNIMGALNGKGGTVFLINPHGITFGEGASVDVGSLVASTLQISDSDFLNDAVYNFSNTKDVAGNTIANIDGKIAIKQGADVTAEDGYVALLAYNIDNAGTITAPDVAMAAGQQIEISYDKKINLKVDVSKDKPAIITTDNNYVLMRGSDVKSIVEKSLIHNTGTIAATRLAENDAGEIVLTAANVTLDSGSNLSSAGGKITTAGYKNLTLNGDVTVKSPLLNMNAEKLTVSDNAQVEMKSGTWAMDAKNIELGGKISAADGSTITTSAIEKLKVSDNAQVEMKLGTWDMEAKNVDLGGKISLGKNSIVTTTATDTLQVRDTAEVHAKDGIWNINAKNVSVTANPDATNDSISPNRVSNTALSKTLADTNVNIVASPVNPEYYSDIVVQDAITKDKGQNTSLTLTAGRNIRVDADILSAEGAGALNITLNSNDTEHTNSTRKDGASIIRANINTNGGSFTTNGKHGTYFGLKRDTTNKEAIGTQRSVITNGGDITLNGDEVLVATGGNVNLNAGSGNVYIAGNVNSANAYYDGGDGNVISWVNARSNAQAAGNATGTKTHLAVITGALEDSVATSTINTDYTKNCQGYVGGHVVKVKADDQGYAVDKDGKRITFSTDSNGNTTIDGELADISLPAIIDSGDNNGKIESFGCKEKNKGWYKLQDATDPDKVIYAHFWAWTEGEETGKVFFVQTTGENLIGDMEGVTKESNPEWFNAHGFALKTGVGDEVYYTNFAPTQPDADNGHDDKNHTEMALSINYDSHKGGNDVLYSQWNDTCDNPDNVKHYVVEEELGKTSLQVEANNVTMNGEIGNLTRLKSVDVNASGNVLFNGLVNVDETISVKGNNITIKDKLTADAKNVDNAIDLRAQNNFINEASDSANTLKVGEGSHWKVYSYSPFADKLGDLNSNNFAEWGWDGTSATSATGTRFIFKYHPTLTFTVNNASKKYGETLSDTGYTFTNSLSGRYTQNFYDGDDAKLREHYGTYDKRGC